MYGKSIRYPALPPHDLLGLVNGLGFLLVLAWVWARSLLHSSLPKTLFLLTIYKEGCWHNARPLGDGFGLSMMVVAVPLGMASPSVCGAGR